MVNVDKLLDMDSIFKKIDENEKLMNNYLKKFAQTLYPGDKGAYFDTSIMYDVDDFDSFIKMENVKMIDSKDIEKYKKCALEYAQLNQRLENFEEGKGLNLFDFYEYKDRFLTQLVSTQHIRDIDEDPKEFLKKLIELYGEKELADFSYTEYSEEDYEFYTTHPSRTFKISDFVSGEEDKVIELVSDETLRKELLASKLKNLSENGVDIAQYIQEYVDADTEHGKDKMVYFDEFEGVNIEETLLDFAKLPISQDRNFYAYIATHLDEMELPFETFLDYVDPNMIDSEFDPEIANARNTKQYKHKDKYAYKPAVDVDPELLAWLEGKEDELSSEEATAQKYSELEALRDKREGKEGQNIGEE